MQKIFLMILVFIIAFLFTIPVLAIDTIPLQGISLDRTAITLTVGQTYALKIKYMPEDTTQKFLRYSSSDNNVATVSNIGVITALKSGNVTIKAYSSFNPQIFAECAVTVADQVTTAPTQYTPQQSATPANPVSQTIVIDSSKGILDIGYDGKDKYVSVGKNGSINFSADGQSWGNVYSGTDQALLGIDYGRNKFVAVGYNGVILVSGNGRGWRRVESQSLNRLNGVTWGKYGFAAVGDSGTILFSKDGMKWKDVDSGTYSNLEGIVWNDEKYVAVGEKGVIVTSEDGTTWRTQESGTSKTLWAVTWNGKEFTVAGDTILSSPDGTNWTDRMPGDNQYLFSVAANDSLTVVIGDFGRLFSSSDGVNWVPGHVTSIGYITGIIWAGDKFLLGDESGRIYTSSNGLDWNMALCSTREIKPLQAVTKTIPSNMEENVQVGKQIVINFAVGFSFDMTAADIRITDPSGKELGRNIVVSPDMSSISILASLNSKTVYKVTLGEGTAIDNQNNPSKEYVFSFKTKAIEPVKAIQKTSPANGQKNVLTASQIKVYFKPGYKYNANSTVTIKDATGKKIACKVQGSANSGIVTISASLAKNKKYFVTLEEGLGYDNKGTYSAQYAFGFTTGSR